MKKIFPFIACLLACIAVMAKDPVVTDVSIIGEGNGNGGSTILTVTCSAKKADKVTDADIAKSAIRGVLFKGWADKSTSKSFDSSTNHPPIAGSPEVENQHFDYFRSFFDTNAAMSYVSILPDTRKVMKNGKVYHVSQMVSVNTSELRKKLERDNIIKSLRKGW